MKGIACMQFPKLTLFKVFWDNFLFKENYALEPKIQLQSQNVFLEKFENSKFLCPPPPSGQVLDYNGSEYNMA